jgi:phosphatidylglycerol:prolipoprotein diacylglycerol transferase
MFPTIQIGPFTLQTSGLFVLIGVWLGLILSEKYSVRQRYPTDKLYNLVFIPLIAGLVGARISFFMSNFTAFSGNLPGLFSLNLALFDPFGGFVFACLAGLIYGRREKLPLWETLDVLTPFLAVVFVGIGFSHLASGNAYGRATDLPWGIQLWGARRHPSQVYEILASLATLGFIWRDSSRESVPGMLFLKFLAITSIWFVFLEGFRGDSHILLAGIRTNQITAFIVLGCVIYAIEKRISRKRLFQNHNEVGEL